MDSNGGTQTLSSAAVLDEAPAAPACPRCNGPRSSLQVQSTRLRDISISRCPQCGCRSTCESSSRLSPSCAVCGLPFLSQDAEPGAGERCSDCRDGGLPDDLPEPPIVEATEHELREAVAQNCRFVASPGLSAYLNRLAGQVARHVDGAPARSRVVLIDDPVLVTLALPSGLVLMSLGVLDGLEDEAELVFVLGHELAHAAKGEAARRLVRLGLSGVRSSGAAEEAAWRDAARDMVALGYGRARELDADARSLGAFLALGYDPNSVLRYLDRLEARMRIADPALADLALAHPTPTDRMRQVTRSLHGRTESGPVKTNREVFRRAAGHEALTSGLDPVTLAEADADPGDGQPGAGLPLLWTAAGVALVATLIALLGLFLST